MIVAERAKLMIAAVTLAGAVALGSTAFTSTGLATSGQAASAQFVGGTVSQSVTGATLSIIAYGYTDGTNTVVDEVTLTFANDLTDGMTPTVAFLGGDAGSFTCDPIISEVGSNTSLCDGDTVTNITGIAVTVA
jgi:hypothetical protein